MFINFQELNSTWGKEQPVMTTREKLKKDAAQEYQKLIVKGWRRTEENLKRKVSQGN